MEKQWVFDTDFTRGYTKVRQDFIAAFLESIRGQVELKTAIDVGAGVGYFTAFLRELGFDVVGVDGRAENVAEAARRHPDIKFVAQDVEGASFSELGKFDLVLCVGLLYHLENPFRAIRNVSAITDKLLVVESMCAPGDSAGMELLDEAKIEDQGLNYVAFYPTEACLIKMLYRAGFSSVYKFRGLPEDEQFADTFRRRRSRIFLVATNAAIDSASLSLAEEPIRYAFSSSDPWITKYGQLANAWNERWMGLKVSGQRMARGLGQKNRHRA